MNEIAPFFDSSLDDDTRITALLAAMTLEEKQRALAGGGPNLERLGVRVARLGGEAAHGVEARNDQWGSGIPDETTSFPQPIGMSASWDTALIREAGRITGSEARILAEREDQHGRGLSRWAPTVDLERDPRWGRNEEGYGEDATLTGEMAGSYVRGMRGDDPHYILCGATLKHFYANNTENGRGWKNSTVDVRNREELYLQPFYRVIAAGATGVMTAYNRINGVAGILNREVLDILKKKHGLLHAVSDGGALSLVTNLQHEVGLPAEAIVGAIRAGVDSMSDHPDIVTAAAAEACAMGILSEEEIDGALRNQWRFRLRLGLNDGDKRQIFSDIGELCSGEAKEICLKLSEESLVLLKNDKQCLPLDADRVRAGLPATDGSDSGQPDNTSSLALIGPMGDAWYQDWYGGTPPYRTTLLQGMKTVLGAEVPFDDGYDVVSFSVGGRPVQVDEAGRLVIGEGAPDRFLWMDWGEGNLTLKHVSTGKFVQSRFYGQEDADFGVLAADKDAPFDWFVMEIFHWEEGPDHTLCLQDRFRRPVCAEERDGVTLLKSSASAEDKDAGIRLTRELVSDGTKRACLLAQKAETVILALGCCSMICAKEEIDRRTILLAPAQRELIRAVSGTGRQVVVVLFANYPYSFDGLEQEASAILLSATGSQEMGLAAARALFGLAAPAGRLVQTWYASDACLPDINDYDIIRGGRTYRYYEGRPLWPFGFGLTYTDFAYRDLAAVRTDKDTITVRLVVENTGKAVSDEVVQIYGSAPPSRVKKPLRQLLAFTRLPAVAPGERREVELRFSVTEFAFYDTISAGMMVEGGTYRIYAGRHCMDEAVETTITLEGEHPGVRDASHPIRADHYDDCGDIMLVTGAHGLTAVAVQQKKERAEITFRDCSLPADTDRVLIMIRSETPCTIDVLINGQLCGSFAGDTATYVPDARFRENSLKEGDPQPERWPAVNCEIPVKIKELPPLTGRDTVTFALSGGIRFMRWRFSDADRH